LRGVEEVTYGGAFKECGEGRGKGRKEKKKGEPNKGYVVDANDRSAPTKHNDAYVAALERGELKEKKRIEEERMRARRQDHGKQIEMTQKMGGKN